MEDFTPLSGLFGGVLIGVAVTMMLWLNGRIAGISGIVGGLLTLRVRGSLWRVAFVVGLVLGAFAYIVAAGDAAAITLLAPLPVVVLGGLLVGFGTRMGSGCTSGHGLCGIARFSRRSIAATAVFFGVAMVTVYLTHHVL